MQPLSIPVSEAQSKHQQNTLLQDISLVTNVFGDGEIFKDILLDWFHFIGGKPGEVVVVDCGSDRTDQTSYWNLYQAGLIDQLQLLQPNHEDNATGVESGYIKEYTAANLASRPYILWFHSDTLPYRQGHDTWLEEAIGYLEREDVMAISGAFNLPSKHHDAWDGWYFSDKCSLNFALMKRDTFINAVHEFAHDFILSGFKSENPAAANNQHRYLLEVALEQYIQRHNVYSLCKVEDINWTVFHTNTHNEVLRRARQRYLKRQGVAQFMNIGFSDQYPDPSQARYYGKPGPGLLKQLRVWFGQSAIGPYWRQLKDR